ncbi:MAG: hypothetical protein CL512_04810 [Actinobacteria bacterium]|nr:hypothetical protein [Actinomycetota bacterium]
MSQMLWIIDPDPTSAQALRSAIDLLGPDVETHDHIPTDHNPPQAVLIAGSVGSESLQQWIGELRRMGGNGLLPITLIGGLTNNADALAFGADHYLDAPLIIADLWDHLRGFLTLSTPSDPEREIPLSRGFVDRNQTEPTPVVETTTNLGESIPEHGESIPEHDESIPEHDESIPEHGESIPEHDEHNESIEAIDGLNHNSHEESERTSLESEYSTEDFSALEESSPNDLAIQSDENKDSISDADQTHEEEQSDSKQAIITPPLKPEKLSSTNEHNSAEPIDNEALLDHTTQGEQENEIVSVETSTDHDTDDAPHNVNQLDESSLQTTTLSTDSHDIESRSEDAEAKDLFGLKQPKEVENLTEKSENEHKETDPWQEEPSNAETDFADDSAWGLDDNDASSDANTTGWDTQETSSSTSWGNEESTDSDWGEPSPSWGSETTTSESWGDTEESDDTWGSSGSWSGTPSLDQTSSNLSQIGQQLMPPEVKPRAPVSPLGQLHATGLLGLLARCGQERVSGRVTWRHDTESIILHLQDGRLKALNSALFDHDLLQAALAQGWINNQELAGVEHLMQRRHSSAASILAREGIKSSDAIQQLAQNTAERILLRCANLPGGYAQFHPEMDYEQAVAINQTDTVSRLITLCESLVESSLWAALVGGDDAIPTIHSTALPQHLPGREALHAADGVRSLLELATSHGVAINELRSGCLAALVLGQIELRKVGVSSIQQSHRPDQTFERMLTQIRSGNYFTVLGLPEAHSAAEVHRAFAARVSLLRLHLHANHPRFVEAYQELEEARDVLLDPDLRAQYRSANPQTLER